MVLQELPCTHLTGAVEYAAFLLPGRNHADFGHLYFLVL